MRFLFFFALCVCSIFADDLSKKATPIEAPLSEIDWHEQRLFFEKNGYLWIKDFFTEKQVALLRGWTEEINDEAQTVLSLARDSGKTIQYLLKHIPGILVVVPEAKDPSQVCRAEDLQNCYPDFGAFVQGTVISYIGRLMGEPYVPFKDKINFKWPGGGAFLPHQDFPAYELFGPREHVTAMISIDRATVENGCLYVAKDWRDTFVGVDGIDQDQLAEGRVTFPYVIGGSSHGAIEPKYSEKISWLALETSPRDLVLFNSFIPHYSEPNRSKGPRRAMFLTNNKLRDGDHRRAYYHAKRNDPDNPVFHIGTPTNARGK